MTVRARNRFTAEFRQLAVQTVLAQEQLHSSRWAAVEALAPEFGCATQTLDKWVRKAEAPTGRPVTSAEQRLVRQVRILERENRRLRKINIILRKASAYFALAELEQ